MGAKEKFAISFETEVPVAAVWVEATFSKTPEVKPFAVVERSIPVPEVRALLTKTKAEVDPVPVTTDEVNVWAPVPDVMLIAAAPPEFPREVTIPDPLPMVVVLLDVSVVKAPEPGVLVPTDTKLAAPAVVTFQLSSVIDTPVDEAEPMVIVLATASDPIVIVFALVPPSPIWMVSAPVPVPKLMVRVTESVVPRFSVVAAPPSEREVVVVLKRATVI